MPSNVTYATIGLSEDLAHTNRTGLRAELDNQYRRSEPEIVWARRRAAELENERRRLSRGIVTGAIPEDLAIEEQLRIAAETKQANAVLHTAELVYSRIEDNLITALEYVGRAEAAYRRSGPIARRLSNQSIFKQVFLARNSDGHVYVASAILNEPWATLLAEDFAKRMAENTANPDQLSVGRGSNKFNLVPPAGFEPATPGLGVRRSIP